jgi:hypothetical protein
MLDGHCEFALDTITGKAVKYQALPFHALSAPAKVL